MKGIKRILSVILSLTMMLSLPTSKINLVAEDSANVNSSNPTEIQDQTEDKASQVQDTETPEVTTTPVVEETPAPETTEVQDALFFGDLEANVDGKHITIHSDGAFPEGVQVSVTKVDSTTVIDELKEKVNAELQEDQIYAFDFDFYVGETHNIEPTETVEIKVEGVETNQQTSVFHIDDQAEQVVTTSDDNQVVFQASAFSIYAIVTPEPSPTDGKIWVNDDQTTTYSTLTEAVTAAGANGTIHIAGNFGNQTAYGATINNGITLIVEENTTIDGANQVGITLNNAKITTKPGATLTMSNFTTALKLTNGSEINDGTYVFTNVENGFDLQNTTKIVGTSKETLSITSTAKTSKVGFEMKTGSEVRNATLILNGGKFENWTYRTLNVYDAHIEIKDVWLYPYPLNLNQSYLKVSGRFGVGLRGGHVLSIYEKPGVANDSEIVVEGSRVNVVNGDGLTLNNSTMTVRNSPDGGFNVNYGGKIVLNSSTLNSDNVRGALIGAGNDSPSNVIISGDSVINAKEPSLYGSIGVKQGNYYVTGGAFNIIKPSDTETDRIPTNSPEYGNDRLTLFKLADPSITTLEIPYTGGTYTYNVAKADANGNKYVWVPAGNVTYQLLNANATFADGTTEDKSFKTVRGYPLSFNPTNTEIAAPTDANGIKFLGWKYKDDQGEEHDFDYNQVNIEEDLLVYAKWESKSVVYHGLDTVNIVENVTTDSYAVLSFDEVKNKNSEFEIPGKVFKYWTTSPEDNEESKVEAGTDKTFGQDETQHDYYAQYQDLEYTVKFSANGGTFGQSSIYKTRTDVFTIEQDENGGEVAVLNKKAKYNQKLFELIGTLDHNTLVPDQTATKEGFLIHEYSKPVNEKPKGYWAYASSTEAQDIYFDDYSYRFFGIPFKANGRNPQITADTTYYMIWAPDPALTTTNSATLTSDLFISDISKTSEVQYVLEGKSFPVNMHVDFASLKEAINSLNYEDSQEIKNARLNLTAKFKTFIDPYSVSAVTPMSATLSKDGGSLKVGNINFAYSGTPVPVTFATTPTTFGELRTMINAIGTELSSRSRAARSASDTLGITLNSFSISSSSTPQPITADLSGDLLFTVNGRNIVYNFADTQDSETADPEVSGFATRVQAQPAINGTLTADMRIQDSTTQEAPYEVYPVDLFTIYGDLDVSPIKEQIQAVKDSFGGNTENISLENVSSKFTTTVDIPEEVLYFTNQITATLSDTDLFKITETSFVKGNDGASDYVKIVMELNKEYSSFDELYEDVVNKTDDTLTIELTPLGADNVPEDKVVILKGTVVGDFSGEAVTAEGGRQVFNFRWNAKQDPDTKDVNNPDDDTIQASLKIKKMDELTLNADISSKGDTEHTALYPVVRGESVEFTGHLDISSIQRQIEAYAGTLDGNKTYNVSGVDSAFFATISIPVEDYEMNNVTFTLNDTSLFEIVEPVETVERDGNRYFTVEMRIKDAYNNTTFEELKNAVTSVNPNLEVTAKGFKVKDSVNEGDKLVVKGSVQGYFIATVTNEDETSTRQMAFLWNGVQTEDGKDKDLGDGGEPSDIQFTSVVPNDIALNGDILVFGNTEHDAVYTVGKHEDMDFVGTLDVTRIQQAINLLADNFDGNEEEIKLNETDSQFVATITFAPEYMIPSDLQAQINDESLFEITSTQVDGQRVTVVMDLKDDYKASDYLFTDLKTAVTNNVEQLEVTLKGIKLGDEAVVGNLYRAIGTVSGKFTSIASSNTKNQKFAYTWIGRQKGEGKDATLSETDDMISFTAEVIDRPMEDLPADIRIGEETTHTAYYSVTPGQILDYTGWLSVQPIKDKIKTMVTNSGFASPELESITLEDVVSRFVATITFAQGLEVPQDVNATLSDTSMFEIVDTTITGNQVRVMMKLKDEYTNLKQLVDALEAHPEALEVVVHGIKVNDDAPNNVLYSAVGTVLGTFDAKAMLNTVTSEYHFGWVGKQTDEGRDYNQTDLDRIALTVIVKKPQTPTTIITPTVEVQKPVKAVPKTGIN